MAVLSSEAIISVAELQAWPGMEDVSNDNAILLINRATARIKRYLGRDRLVSQEATMYLDGSGVAELALPDGPLTVLTNVHDDSNRDFDSDSVIDVDEDIIVYGGYRGAAYKDERYPDWPTKLALYNSESAFSLGRQVIKVVAQVGYNDEENYFPMPEELKQSCTLLCAFYWNNADPGLKSEKTRTYSYTRFDPKDNLDMPPEVAGLLTPFMTYRIY